MVEHIADEKAYHTRKAKAMARLFHPNLKGG